MKTDREKVAAIGEALIEMASSRRPMPAGRLGDLLKSLALVYGRVDTAGPLTFTVSAKDIQQSGRLDAKYYARRLKKGGR